MNISRIGVDLAKNVFQVHGVNSADYPVWQVRLIRDSWIQTLID